jgi:hypothetical protein
MTVSWGIFLAKNYKLISYMSQHYHEIEAQTFSFYIFISRMQELFFEEKIQNI